MPEQTLTEMEADLRAMGVQADASSDDNEQESSPAPVEKPEPVPTEEGNQPPAEEGKTVESAEPSAESAEPPKKSRYAQEWERLNKAKEKAAERERTLEEREKTIAEKAKALPQDFSDRDADGHTAADYEKAAKLAEDKAREASDSLDDEQAKQHAEAARELKATAEKLRAGDFRRRWHANFQDGLKELGLEGLKDPASEEGQKFKALLQTHPEVFEGHPLGGQIAAKLYAAQRDAALVPALQRQVQELTKEKQRLDKLTALTSTPPAKMSGEESKKDRTEQDLLRMAAEHDAAA